jgi:hypothetical protein
MAKARTYSKHQEFIIPHKAAREPVPVEQSVHRCPGCRYIVWGTSGLCRICLAKGFTATPQPMEVRHAPEAR